MAIGSTSGIAPARLSGPSTNWSITMWLTPGYLLDLTQQLPLTSCTLKVLFLAWTLGEQCLIIPPSKVDISSLLEMGINDFYSLATPKVVVGFLTLCARATRAILNHAPIGEYRQRFFPAECTQCPCGHCQVETRRHIFANCSRFAHSPLIDPSPSIKDLVDFLKEHPSAFAFPSQERPPPPSEPPWVLKCSAFLTL